MVITIKLNNNKAVFNADTVSIKTSCDFLFRNAADSYKVYTQLKEMGIRCYHAGVNAPHGASVMMYRAENRNVSITI